MSDIDEDGEIVHTAWYTLPICNIKVTVQLFGGHYDEKEVYIKSYLVMILLNNFKTDPFETLYDYLCSQPFGGLGWDPFTEKNGVISYCNLVSGFENVKPHINDYIINIANFK